MAAKRKKQIQMMWRILLFLLLTSLNVKAQQPNVAYIWKTAGIENDTIVSELRFLNHTDYTETTYVGDRTIALGDYKTWPLRIRHGKVAKGKKFLELTEYNAANTIYSRFAKVKRNEIRFYHCNSKTKKWFRFKEMTYRLANRQD